LQSRIFLSLIFSVPNAEFGNSLHQDKHWTPTGSSLMVHEEEEEDEY